MQALSPPASPGRDGSPSSCNSNDAEDIRWVRLWQWLYFWRIDSI